MPISDKAYLQINQALFSLVNAYESRMSREERFDAQGLKLSDCSVLMVLGQAEPINASQLSEMMDVNPGTISVYVQRLIEKGLIQREQDTEDRRTWWLTLTETGKAIARDIIEGTVTYTHDFLEALDEDELRMLHRLLLKAAHSLGYHWL